ncbi:MAG TPA: hypothetical protein VID27_15955 [Blastocatellia bacterium]
MFPLFQNPLLRLIRSAWWLAALLVVIVPLILFGRWGLEFALIGGAGLLTLIAGMIGAAGLHGAAVSVDKAINRWFSHHRFLCPNCLHFGQFHFACSQCGTRIHLFIVNTGGAYIIKCPHCRRALFSEPKNKIAAWCERCQATCDLDPHHHRQVRVVATLFPRDFERLCKESGAEKDVSIDGIRCSWKDDGKQLTYILQLGDLAHARDESHALWDVEALWVSADENEVLKLGQASDQLILNARLSDSRAKLMTVCVPQAEISPTVSHVLTTRFGQIRCGIEAASFICEDESSQRIILDKAGETINISASVDAAQE